MIALGADRCLDRSARLIEQRLGSLHALLGFRHFGFERHQAIAFGKAFGGSTWRIGRGSKAVPAPHIALDADEALARLQFALQCLAEIAADNADMGKAPRQSGGRIDEVGQGQGAIGQWHHLGQRRQAAPMHRGCLIGGRIDVFAERSTEGCLIAALHFERIDQRRPQVAVIGAQEIAQRAHFRRKPFRSASRVFEDLPAFGLALARLAQLRFGIRARLLRFGDHHEGGLDCLRQPFTFRGRRQLRHKRLETLGCFLGVAFEAADALVLLGDDALSRIALYA